MVMAEIKFSSQNDFAKAIEKGVILVDFIAPWCAPCRTMEPVIAQLAKAYQDRATICKVDIDEYREIALNLSIQSIPTIIIFKEGREKRRFIGLQTAGTLEKTLKHLIEK
jgi:thioredoxin 1